MNAVIELLKADGCVLVRDPDTRVLLHTVCGGPGENPGPTV